MLITETGQDTRRVAESLDAMLDHRTDGIVFALMGAKQIDLPPVPANVRTIVLNGASTAGIHRCCRTNTKPGSVSLNS